MVDTVCPFVWMIHKNALMTFALIHKEAVETLFEVYHAGERKSYEPEQGLQRKPTHIRGRCVWAVESASSIFPKLVKALLNHKTSVTSPCKQLRGT